MGAQRHGEKHQKKRHDDQSAQGEVTPTLQISFPPRERWNAPYLSPQQREELRALLWVDAARGDLRD